MMARYGKRFLIVFVILLTLSACNLTDLFGGGDETPEPGITETMEAPPTEEQQIEVTAAIRTAPTEEQQGPPPGGGSTVPLPYYENFDNTGSGWEVGDYDNGSVGYSGGEYFVTSTSPSIFMWGQAMRNFGDVDMTVTARQVQSPSNNNTGYGVMCRVTYDPQNDLLFGYALRISGDGFYSISKFTGSEMVELVPWTQTTAIVQGNSSNEMRVVCNGSTLVLYVNGTMIAEATDNEYSTGDIGFSGTNFEEGVAEFRYDNLAVQSPSDVGGGSGGENGESNGAGYAEDFTSPNPNWEVGDYEDGSVGFANGEYFVSQYGDASFMWGQAGMNYTDVEIRVDAYQLSGPTNNNTGYGVMCRVDFNMNVGELSGYLLWIGADQTYSIIKWSHDDVVTLVDWGQSNAINAGSNAVNQIRAVCDGNQFALYVNGTLLAEAVDSEFSGGDIAFAGTSFETDSAEFRFDNLLLISR